MPRLLVLPVVITTGMGRGRAEQQFTHPPLPGTPLGAEEQQLGGGQPDGVHLGAHQMGGSAELLGGQRGADPVSEALPVAAALGATPLNELIAAYRAQCLGSWPALEHAQNRGAPISFPAIVTARETLSAGRREAG